MTANILHRVENKGGSNAGIFNGYGGALGTIAVLTNSAGGAISGTLASAAQFDVVSAIG